MPRNANSPHPGQEALIVAHPESGQMAERDFSHEGLVDLNEHRLHLLNTLSLFGAINQREMFYGYQQSVAKERYKGNAEQVLEGAKRVRNEMVDEARDEFYRSQGVPQAEEIAAQFPNFDLDDYRSKVKRDWNVFQARYRSERHSEVRAGFMKQLRAGISVEQSESNREHEIRPFISDKAQKKAVRPSGREYPLLSSRERLLALKGDPRAGFIPKNDREKIKCYTFLDYLDNPEYPLGVTNQLIEIFIHQQKGRSEQRVKTAQRSVVSVTYEIGDHLDDALQSLHDINMLERDLDGARPDLMLTDDVPADHPGVARLIRFRDLQQLRDKGAVKTPVINPLRAIEDRRPHADPDKNKTVADPYVTPNQVAEMEAYIAQAAASMSIRDTRRLIKQALADERAREAFWHDRMVELSKGLSDMKTFMVAPLAGRLLVQSERAAS